MSRFVGSVLVAFCFCLGFWASPTAAKEKPEKSTSATAAEAVARESLRQALVAEAHGDNDARARHLAAATAAVADLNETNWQHARILADGNWESLADLEAAAANDSKLLEYRSLRDKASNSKLVLALARWCVKNDFGDAAELHYAQLLHLAEATPAMRAEAIERLDLVQVNGMWHSRSELEAKERQRTAIAKALEKWRPGLKKLQIQIDGADFRARDAAIAEFKKLTDVTMIPVVESFLLDAGDEFHQQSAIWLARFPHQEATAALVRFAVLSESALARDKAIEALKRRSVHDYGPLLLSGLVAPLESRFEITKDRSGRIAYTQLVVRDSPAIETLFVTHQIALPVQTVLARGDFRQTQARARAEEAKQENAALDAGLNVALQARLANAPNERSNRRIFAALEGATGEQLPRDVRAWWNWWQEYNQKSWPKTTEYVFNYEQFEYERPVAHSCFLAGTPVRTETGLAAIETIQLGDRVLAQDQDTGELAYKLVLRTTVRPPAEMLEIQAGSEKIATTLGHPFWVSGQGWRMAKQLKVGELLHSIDGAIRIDAIEPLPKQPAHNLVVADFNSYFVGSQSLLVHDNEYRKPTRAIVPGLIDDE